MSIKVQSLKLVEFPAGFMRVINGSDEKQIYWARRYTMIVPLSGRGGISFGDGDILSAEGNLSQAFAKTALKRVFNHALGMRPNESVDDPRTGIKMRRIGRSLEVGMPCGEVACIKRTTLTRLLKEMDVGK